jgi:hypothetical protein
MRDGHKTQTRRVKRPREELWYAHRGRQFVESRFHHMPIPTGDYVIPTVHILDICYRPVRVKWQVGRRYAINPPPGLGDKGRMGKAVGSYECVGLREEPLQSIANRDVVAEGINPLFIPSTLRTRAFVSLWDSLHKKGERWADNPTVWVIEMGNFEFEWEGRDGNN